MLCFEAQWFLVSVIFLTKRCLMGLGTYIDFSHAVFLSIVLWISWSRGFLKPNYQWESMKLWTTTWNSSSSRPICFPRSCLGDYCFRSCKVFPPLPHQYNLIYFLACSVEARSAHYPSHSATLICNCILLWSLSCYFVVHEVRIEMPLLWGWLNAMHRWLSCVFQCWLYKLKFIKLLIEWFEVAGKSLFPVPYEVRSQYFLSHNFVLL